MTGWEPATDAEVAMRDALRAQDQELYFRILARTDLLLPVSAQSLANRTAAGWGTWTTGGRTHVLAFTSAAALRASLGENAGSSRRTAYADLASGWPNHEWWLAVNPGLPIEGYLPAWFVAQLSRGDVRLPGRTMGARARLERVESLARTRNTPAPPERDAPPRPAGYPPPATPDRAETTPFGPHRPAAGPTTYPNGAPGATPVGGEQFPPPPATPPPPPVTSPTGSAAPPPTSPAPPATPPTDTGRTAVANGWLTRPGPPNAPTSPATPRPAAEPSLFDPAPRREPPVDPPRPALRATPPTRGGLGGQPFPSRRPAGSAAENHAPAFQFGTDPEATRALRSPGEEAPHPASPTPRTEEATRALRPPTAAEPTQALRPSTAAEPTRALQFGSGHPETTRAPGVGGEVGEPTRAMPLAARRPVDPDATRAYRGGIPADEVTRPLSARRPGPADEPTRPLSARRPGPGPAEDVTRPLSAQRPGHGPADEATRALPAAWQRADAPPTAEGQNRSPQPPATSGAPPAEHPELRAATTGNSGSTSFWEPASVRRRAAGVPPPQRASATGLSSTPGAATAGAAGPDPSAATGPATTGPAAAGPAAAGPATAGPSAVGGASAVTGAAEPTRDLGAAFRTESNRSVPNRSILDRDDAQRDTPPSGTAGQDTPGQGTAGQDTPGQDTPGPRFSARDLADLKAAHLDPSNLGPSDEASVPQAPVDPPATPAAGPPDQATVRIVAPDGVADAIPADQATVRIATPHEETARVPTVDPPTTDLAEAQEALSEPASVAEPAFDVPAPRRPPSPIVIEGTVIEARELPDLDTDPGAAQTLPEAGTDPAPARPIVAADGVEEPGTAVAPDSPDEPTAVIASDDPTAVVASDDPTAVMASDGPTAVIASDDLTAVIDQDGPTAVIASDDPTAAIDADGPTAVIDSDGPTSAMEPDGAAEPEATPEPDFRPANSVEQDLLTAAGSGSTDSFLSTLLLARVLLPVAPHSAAGSRPGDPGFVWRTERLDGETYVVVHTSPERLADHHTVTVDTVLVKFVQLIRAWPDEDWLFAVNPGTPIGAKLPGEQIVGLANWAAEVGLGADVEEPPTAAGAAESAVRPRNTPPTVDANLPVVMQKAVAPSQLAYYLERGYDRVSGFVHRASELAHLNTPARLHEALGLSYPDSPFARDADEIYVLRWPAHRPSLYRIPYGGQNEDAMRAMEGWVIERPPFRGNGFAPGESSDVIAEFKVDSARLPYGAQLWRISSTGTEHLVATLDTDALRWRQVGDS
ncbi:SseB family protein [Micromonospora sp. NPDC000207]|uniref:SseB family protein n=1 Tax=Micromonospora sp. NPDC000207 TaxID=3154246 RepID=UPI00332046C3